MYHDDLLRRATVAWGVTYAGKDDAPLPGSPARSRYRTAIRSADGRRYVLEEIGHDAVRRRERLALLLHRLRSRGLPVLPHRPRADGRGHVSQVGDTWWMLTPYLSGDALPRPGWVHDERRGTAMGVFLADLALATCDVTDQPRWDLRAFAERLARTISGHRPDLLPALDEPLALVRQELYPALDALPSALCHGDYHPLNVIWRGDAASNPSMGAIIDWEFAGLKPALYDAALAIGCAGSEKPEALTGGYTRALIASLRQRGVGTPPAWQRFPALVLATRLAWLSEWLRAGDRDMVGLEMAYLALLVRRQRHLADAWRGGPAASSVDDSASRL